MIWLGPDELRVGLGCMRLPEGKAAIATIDAAVEAGITVFDTARAYEGNEELLATRPSSRARRANRDEGRHEPAGRRLGAGRSRALDPRGLRGEPRRARWPRRSTSTSCTRPIRARRGAPRSARSPDSSTRVSSRASASATSTARSSTRRSSIAPISAVRGRTQRLRRLGRCAAGSRPLRRSSESRSSPTRRSAGHAARERSLGTRRSPRSRRRTTSPSPRSALAWVLGACAERRRVPGARRPDAARSAARTRQSTLTLTGASSRVLVHRRDRGERREGRRRRGHGHSWSGEVARRGGVRRARVPPTQPRRARRHASRHRRRARRGSRAGTREAVLDNTYLDARRREATSSRRQLATALPSAASGSTPRSHRHR